MYDRANCVVFRKTAEKYGGLSNMAPGFPLLVNGVCIRTSEALYQACRFPHMPDVQRLVIEQTSPMAAKMRSKPFRDQSRPDWDAVRVKVMRWCLRVKLAQNWEKFGALLRETGGQPIVEESGKDDFWGARLREEGTLVGANVLGRLLMELRHELLGPGADSLRQVAPLSIPDFLLLAQPIGLISSQRDEPIAETSRRDVATSATPLIDSAETASIEPDVARYLTPDEVTRLSPFGIRVARNGLSFTRELTEPECRTVWQAVSAIARRRPKSEDWINWFVGDCGNEVDRRLGPGSSERLLGEEEEAYRYTQRLLRLSGATLVALQWTELAIGACVRLLEPEQKVVRPADVLSPETITRQRTLGQLNNLLKQRKVFIDGFEERLDRFVRHRNRFAHHLWTEQAGDGITHDARMASFRARESFMLALLREAADIGRVFKGLFAALGVSLAEQENLKNFDNWFDEWRDYLPDFTNVQRQT